MGERDFWRFNFLVCFERIFTQKQQHVVDTALVTIAASHVETCRSGDMVALGDVYKTETTKEECKCSVQIQLENFYNEDDMQQF